MNKQVRISAQGGVNLIADPTAVGDQESVYAKNLYPHRLGTFGHRKAMGFNRPLITISSGAGTIAPIQPWRTLPAGVIQGFKAFSLSTVPGVDWLAVVTEDGSFTSGAGDHLWVCGPGVSGGALFYIPVLRTRGHPYCFVNFGQRTILFDGTTQGHLICRRRDADSTRPMTGGAGPDDVVVQDMQFVGVQDQPLTPSFGAVRQDRLVLGDPLIGFESTVVWCDTVGVGVPGSTDPDSWRTIGNDAVRARGFRIGTDVEGGLTALWSAATMPQAASPESALYCFKQNAVYIFTGRPGQSTDLTADTINGTASVTRLNIDAGCVAPNTLAWTPQGLVWVGADDVWLMSLGSLPRRCGTKIRPVLEAQPVSLLNRLHAAYHDGAYKLAVYGDGQGPTDVSPCSDHWWLDLRGEQPPTVDSARWWGPQVFGGTLALATGTWALVTETRPNQDRVMLSPQVAVTPPSVLSGGSSGAVGQVPVVVDFEKVSNKDRILPAGEWREWAANTAYAAGDIVRPRLYSGLEFVVRTAGTSAGSQPTWSNITGLTYTITDGSVVWVPRAPGSTTPLVTYLPPELEQDGDILFDWISKEFDAPNPALEKLLDGCDISYQASGPLPIELSLLPDAETDDVSRQLLDPGPRLGVDSLSLTLGNKWQKRFLPPDSGKRSRASTFQVRVKQRGDVFLIPSEFAGYVVGSGTVYPYGNFTSTNAPYEATSASAAVLASFNALKTYLATLGTTLTLNALGTGVGLVFTVTGSSVILATNTASQAWWYSLMGLMGLSSGGAITLDFGTTYASPQSPTYSDPATVVFKEIAPRVRVFKRQPT